MHRLLTGLLVSFFSVVFLPSLGLAQSGQATALLAPEECGRIPQSVLRAWPLTDFTKCTAPIEEVRSGGPGKDGMTELIPYKISFAFVWHAFNPGATIHR